jgi:hypothetical protein
MEPNRRLSENSHAPSRLSLSTRFVNRGKAIFVPIISPDTKSAKNKMAIHHHHRAEKVPEWVQAKQEGTYRSWGRRSQMERSDDNTLQDNSTNSYSNSSYMDMEQSVDSASFQHEETDSRKEAQNVTTATATATVIATPQLLSPSRRESIASLPLFNSFSQHPIVLALDKVRAQMYCWFGVLRHTWLGIAVLALAAWFPGAALVGATLYVFSKFLVRLAKQLRLPVPTWESVQGHLERRSAQLLRFVRGARRNVDMVSGHVPFNQVEDSKSS